MNVVRQYFSFDEIGWNCNLFCGVGSGDWHDGDGVRLVIVTSGPVTAEVEAGGVRMTLECEESIENHHVFPIPIRELPAPLDGFFAVDIRPLRADQALDPTFQALLAPSPAWPTTPELDQASNIHVPYKALLWTSGWYAPESDTSPEARWMSNEGSVLIPLPPEAGVVNFYAYGNAKRVPASVENIQVSGNGTVTRCSLWSDEHAWSLSATYVPLDEAYLLVKLGSRERARGPSARDKRQLTLLVNGASVAVERRAVPVLKAEAADRTLSSHPDATCRVGSGFSCLEPSAPARGLEGSLGWTTERAAHMRVWSVESGVRTLDLTVRSVIEGQIVSATVNGHAAGWSRPLAADVAIPNSVHVHGLCVEGWNAVDLEIAESLVDRSGRELGVLLDAVSFLDAPETPAGPEGASRYLTRGRWRAHHGFSHWEAPCPAEGLDRPFRWCVGERSSLSIRCETTEPGRLWVRLRTAIPHQTVALTIAGEVYRSTPATGRLADVQDVAIDLPFEPGEFILELHPSKQLATGSRSLSFIVEDVLWSLPARADSDNGSLGLTDKPQPGSMKADA